MSTVIPIQNIYYLLCYAWDRLDEGELTAVDAEDCDSLQDLMAKVLISGTQRLLKRGFHRTYRECLEETPSLRGRIAFTPSLRELSWTKGRMVCEFTELSHNTLPNRILKATLRSLLYTQGVDEKHKREMADLLRLFHEITPIRIQRQTFRRIQYQQNLRFYRFLMNVCELVHESLLPSTTDGESTFRDFIRDEKTMSTLFESFVRNFFKRHSKLKVERSQIKWRLVEGDLSRLPRMNTDIELIGDKSHTIIDCKYYREAFTTNWNTERYKTPNLYQLYAYVKNKQVKKASVTISGMLLYPEVSGSFCDRFILQGHPICIASINLNQPWTSIHRGLLELTPND